MFMVMLHCSDDVFVVADEYEIDDIHTSLVELCEKYDIPLAPVIDRMAVALVKLETQRLTLVRDLRQELADAVVAVERCHGDEGTLMSVAGIMTAHQKTLAVLDPEPG